MSAQHRAKIDMIDDHLHQYGSISSWQAIQLYRVTRLAAVIHDLKHRRGRHITSTSSRTEDGTMFTIYHIIIQPQQTRLGL